MRVAEQRDPVRLHRDALLDGPAQRRRGLMRQPVDEVEIDVRNTGGAKAQDRVLDHLGRLDPVDRRLHLRIEFLHAKAGAVEMQRADPPDHLVGERARIAFDRNLGIGFQLEAIAKARHDGGKVVRLEHRRGAAAEMQV